MEKVTKEQYTEAVVNFVDLAWQSAPGRRVAAQLLLNEYNGSDFQLDVAGMGNLDRENFETAVTIIRAGMKQDMNRMSQLQTEATWSASCGISGSPGMLKKEDRQPAPSATAKGYSLNGSGSLVRLRRGPQRLRFRLHFIPSTAFFPGRP